MKTEGNIVCIGLPAWDGDYVKSTVELLRILSNQYRILYVEYAPTYKDIVTALLHKKYNLIVRSLGIIKRLRNFPQETGGDVFVLTPPPVPPVNWVRNKKLYRILNSINALYIRLYIKHSMKRLQITQPIVVNAFNPFLGLPLAGRLNEKALFYYCYDEIRAAQWTRVHGGELEDDLIMKCDGVVCTSRVLQQERRSINPHCYLVNNGVNFELFNQTANDSEYCKDNLPLTVGYIGSIDHRIDYELIKCAAEKAPDIRFLFVGRIADSKQINMLKDLPNVIFIGPQPPESLPTHLMTMDVGIIPFKVNDFTRAIYPLKINEYLAAGKPVIMTPFADLQEFDSLVDTIKSPEGLIQAARAAFDGDTINLRQQRIETARSHSWETRAIEFSRIIRIISRHEVETS